MGNKSFSQAAILTGVAALCIYYVLPYYLVSGNLLTKVHYYLYYAPTPVLIGGLFVLFAFPDELATLISRLLQLLGKIIKIAIDLFMGRVAPMFLNWWSKKKEGVYGNAAFSTKKDVRKVLNNKNRGFAVSPKHALSMKNSFNSGIVIGKPESGKTTSVIINTLLRVNPNQKVKPTYIVTDPAGEIEKNTRGFLETICGYTCKTFGVLDIEASETYNPLEYVSTTGEINQLSEQLIDMVYQEVSGNDVHWKISSKPLLRAIISALKKYPKEFQNLYNVFQILSMSSYRREDIEDLVLNTIDPTFIPSFMEMMTKEDNKFDSEKSNAMNALEKYGIDERFGLLTGTDTIELDKIRDTEDPQIIYLQFPDTELEYYAPMIGIFYQQLYSILRRNHGTGKEQRPIFLLLEEVGAIRTQIKGLETALSQLRKYGVGSLLVCQDWNQMVSIYGESIAKEIFGNTATKIVFLGMENDMAQTISSMLGSETAPDSDGNDRKKPIMEVSELQGGKLTDMVLISRTRSGTIKHLFTGDRGFYTNWRLKYRSDIPAKKKVSVPKSPLDVIPIPKVEQKQNT